MELYVFSTSDAVVGLGTYHEIIRSEQKFDIVWTLAVRYLLYAMSSWTTSFSLSVCWNSVGIHGYGFIQISSIYDGVHELIKICARSSECGRKSMRGEVYVSNRAQVLCHIRNHTAWHGIENRGLMAKRKNCCTDQLYHQRKSAQCTGFRWPYLSGSKNAGK